jgi:hypothetical protein
MLSWKDKFVNCVEKSTIVANFHTWSFCVEKLQKGKTIIINVVQRYGIAWYEAEGQTKWLMEPIPGVDHGWQQK